MVGSASIDLDRYRSNRFGEVLEYAIGDVIPISPTAFSTPGSASGDSEDVDTDV